ncbi:hypothetical protein [Methylophilus sp. YYY-1]|uniref:hypothetical protein n=1 Tax=Methylophilus sp. YYY-1 TaxID=2682087 RepID=UPI0023B24DBF|nr:hypothetical protein [Methylophilus sp. YYY-1]MDF0377671.1 hypothetical protein [Methylophilus sp. YYY-1]
MFIVKLKKLFSKSKDKQAPMKKTLPPPVPLSSKQVADLASRACAPAQTSKASSEDFGTSMAVGMITNNAMIGGMVGGSFAGGLMGDLARDGALGEAQTSSNDCTSSSSSYDTYSSSSDF